MNYELAKKLKKAGFPQPDGVNAQELLLTGRAPVYLCEHGNTHYVCPTDSSVYMPHLSELIKACGDNFYSLSLILEDELEGSMRLWWAMSRDVHKYERAGETPEEAMANLWIALNTK